MQSKLQQTAIAGIVAASMTTAHSSKRHGKEVSFTITEAKRIKQDTSSSNGVVTPNAAGFQKIDGNKSHRIDVKARARDAVAVTKVLAMESGGHAWQAGQGGRQTARCCTDQKRF